MNKISQRTNIILVFIIFTALTTGMSCRESGRNERLTSFVEQEIADSIARHFGNLLPDTPSEDLYRLFNRFCLTHFGAGADPVVFQNFGDSLKIYDGSEWSYVSENSAVIAWDTNLPSMTFVEYGTSISYGHKTSLPERYFYTHIHYLKDLKINTEYHYRLVSRDESGKMLVSPDRSFKTNEIAGAIHIPADMGQPPFNLDKPGATYVVTKDIVAGRNAFNITADNITIDLGGHCIIHANDLITDLDYEVADRSGAGIRMYTGHIQTGLKILNGNLKQGKAENNSEYTPAKRMVHPDEDRKKLLEHNMSQGLNSIELTDCADVEIAGITAEYRLSQTWCMRFTGASGKYDIHHNICLDKGTLMFSRHGGGESRSIGFRGDEGRDIAHVKNDFAVHHNLIKRTRQNGINTARKIYSNEIYVDSWVVNSFAVSPHHEGGSIYDNRIFLTGYYGCGILWATNNLDVHDNFIHMESIVTMISKPDSGRRLIETWGEQDVLAGFRLTNYNKGGQERQDMSYHDNVILGRCRWGAEMRGTEFYSDYSVKNLQCNNNIIRILAQDTLTFKAACIDAQGSYNDRTTHLPIYYRNDSLVSNICNVRFGDDYGQGSNHQFVGCQIKKTGSNPNYHTFLFDGHSSVFNHGFLDCDFIGGAAYDDVYWSDTQSLSNYHISWSLMLETTAGAEVIIKDRKGKIAFKGKAGEKGMLDISLIQSVIRPVEWTNEGGEVEVLERSKHQEEVFSPYVITVVKNGRQKTEQIIMNKKQSVRITI